MIFESFRSFSYVLWAFPWSNPWSFHHFSLFFLLFFLKRSKHPLLIFFKRLQFAAIRPQQAIILHIILIFLKIPLIFFIIVSKSLGSFIWGLLNSQSSSFAACETPSPLAPNWALFSLDSSSKGYFLLPSWNLTSLIGFHHFFLLFPCFSLIKLMVPALVSPQQYSPEPRNMDCPFPFPLFRFRRKFSFFSLGLFFA